MFTCHLTGLTLRTGCAITTQLSASQKHWLIGLASDGEYFNEEAPAQLVLKNDMPYPGEQYSIVRQVDLISVDDNIECLVFDAVDFKAVKDYYKTESGVGARRSGRNKQKLLDVPEEPKKQQAPKKDPKKPGTSSTPNVGNASMGRDEPVVGTSAEQRQLEQQLETFKNNIQTLKEKNAESAKKIKSLQQTARRKTMPKTDFEQTMSEPSMDDDRSDSGLNDSDTSGSGSRARGVKSKKTKPEEKDASAEPDAKKGVTSKKTKPEEKDASAEPDAKKPKPEEKDASAVLDVNIAEHSRDLLARMQQQQLEQHERILEELKDRRANEQLKRKETKQKERDLVEEKRFKKLHAEVSGLKTQLLEQEKANEVKELRDQNANLANSLTTCLKEREDRGSTDNRSLVFECIIVLLIIIELCLWCRSMLDNMKQVKELVALFQPQYHQPGAAHAGGWSTPNGYPFQSPTYQPWAANAGGWSTANGYPFQSPTYQPGTANAGGWSSANHGANGHPFQSPTYQPEAANAGGWSSANGHPLQSPSHQPEAANVGKSKPSSKSSSKRSRSRSRSREGDRKNSPARSASYSRRDIERWDGKAVERWMFGNGVSSNDITTLAGRGGLLRDGHFVLQITNAEFIAQFPSGRSGDIALRVLWSKIDALQQQQ